MSNSLSKAYRCHYHIQWQGVPTIIWWVKKYFLLHVLIFPLMSPNSDVGWEGKNASLYSQVPTLTKKHHGACIYMIPKNICTKNTTDILTWEIRTQSHLEGCELVFKLGTASNIRIDICMTCNSVWSAHMPYKVHYSYPILNLPFSLLQHKEQIFLASLHDILCNCYNAQ